MITQSASRSAEQARGRVRVAEVALRPCGPGPAEYQFSGRMWGQYRLSDPNTLVPRQHSLEADIIVGIHAGKPVAIVRDLVVGTFEVLVRVADLDNFVLAVQQLVKRERVRAAQVSIPASMHDVLLNCVRQHMGNGLLFVVAFNGMQRGPTERDYYTIERVMAFTREMFQSSLASEEAAALRSAIEAADAAFE